MAKKTESDTTYLAVDREIVAEISRRAKAMGVNQSEVTNALLRSALSRGNIELEVKTVSVKTKGTRAKKR